MNVAQNVERGRYFFPDKPALIFEGQAFTYKNLDEMASRVANGLRSLGIERGNRVALFLPNIPEFVFSYLGIQKIGAVVVSINVMLKRDEIKYILNDCTASVLITTEELSEQVSKVDLPDLKHILIVEGEASKGISLEKLMANSSDEAQAIAMERDDPAAIVYTSGTTGFPKGATLSHGNVISNIDSVNRCCGMHSEDRLLLYLPLFHCFGQNFILNAGLNARATIILQRRFEPEQVFESIARDRVTMFFGVPTVFAKLLEMHLDDCDLSSVRYYFSAAAPMPIEIVQRWQARHGMVIHEGYGLTETSPFACYNHDLQYKLGSIGMPIENVEMKIVDREGQEVLSGEVGEIVIRGLNVMLGYWNRPEETAQVLKNGWFHTGDLGRMDSEGYFYIVDRLKDIINMSGFKIYPAEVEQVIYQHPSVAEVAVYGVPDPIKGEIVNANVVLKPGQAVVPKDFLAFCAERMATYKVPRGVKFVDSIPKNSTGKVLKRLLSEKAAQSAIAKNPNKKNGNSGIIPVLNNQISAPALSIAEALVRMLEEMGVSCAFGVSGGAIAPIWATLERSSIRVFHFRHEAGAAFAAIESYFATGRPAVVFTTTGPGITNALTGLFAARWEGAKVIFLSASTSTSQRGRWAFQETSAYTMPIAGLFTSGTLFHYAIDLACADELPEVSHRLGLGLARPGGFVAHLSVPTAIQTTSIETPLRRRTFSSNPIATSEGAIARCAELLSEGPFAIWVGFGARGCAESIRQLAERTGAAVMCSPRGKGIFPEDHPQFIGVTGFGGHASVLTYMQVQRPLRVLVLGTRLGEFTSFWSPVMVPARGFVHVDIDPEVPGVAYPSAETVSVQSDVEMFVKSLLKHFPDYLGRAATLALPDRKRVTVNPRTSGPVRPEVLMEIIQRVIVEGSDAVVMTEAGNSFAWGTHTLRFSEPDRYRVSTGFGSMGHAIAGILGAAIGRHRKAVAIIGDGAMLMNSEVSTAVKYQIPAVWIVLNDARYNMCEQGMALLGLQGVDTQIPQADFVMIARGMGADGIRVEKESALELALEKAMTSTVPFVVDVLIDPTRPAPIGNRIQSLISQEVTQHV